MYLPFPKSAIAISKPEKMESRKLKVQRLPMRFISSIARKMPGTCTSPITLKFWNLSPLKLVKFNVKPNAISVLVNHKKQHWAMRRPSAL